MFSLIHGNRQDILVRLLGHRLKADPPALFAEEVVLVQSEAMERWLRLALAEELGIAAQLRFPFPAGYIWELFGAVLPNVPATSPFSGESLHWRLLRLLGETQQAQQQGTTRLPPIPLPKEGGDYSASLRGASKGGGVWAPLHRYLDNGDIARRDSLAVKLAATFERYLAYRPDWLSDWSAGRLRGLGPNEGWQAALWRALIAELPQLPEAHPRQAFFAALERDPSLLQRLPKRISLFGIGAMPPPTFAVFRELGRYLDVTLYLLNPCREHWGQIVDARVKARAALERPEESAYLETGHALLGSLGSVARQFFDMASSQVDAQVEAFEDIAGPQNIVIPAKAGIHASAAMDSRSGEARPVLSLSKGGNDGRRSLLASLQADMLDLVDRGPDAALPVAAGEDSLQVHVCHSPQREVDVLHDRLLALFDTHPDLRPTDVLVLTPDMDTYAPLIEARFGAGGPGAHSIPYTIADRPAAVDAPLHRAFANLLDLAAGRLEAEAVLAFLEQPAVAPRWGFADNELETLRDWVRNAAIRWGVDAPWRSARELPAEEANTWRSGFERLLLGVAMPSFDSAALRSGRSVYNDATPLFEHLLPAAEISGSASRDLGRFISFGEALFAAHGELNRARPVAEWTALFEQLLTRFCATEGEEESAQTLRQAWQSLAEAADAAECRDAVPLAVVRRALDDALAASAPGWAFFGGGVTFAALRAHRAVPVRVLCLLGMNDGQFPRNPAVPGFDLTLAHPRAGDRAYREEDRHAFLETLLSPRDALHISYVGRNVRDNSPLPPSSVVDELLDTLQRGFLAADGGPLRGVIVVEHPLQAFSRRYFDGSSGLFSYAQGYAAASRAALNRDHEARPFLAVPLPEAELPEREIDLDQLIRFLLNPARHLLQQRLGIQLEAAEGMVESAEPFLLSGLERYGLDETIIAQRLAGRDMPSALAYARADGVLPHGQAGEAQFRQRWQVLDSLARQVAAAAPVHEAVPFFFTAHGLTLRGQLSNIAADGLVLWRPAKAPKGKDWLRLWVHHLALQLAAAENPGLPRESRLLTLDGAACLKPLADAEGQMAELLALWQWGQRQLLPLFPNTAFAYVEGKGSWRNEWDSEQGMAEAADPWFDLAYGGLGGLDPLDDDFQTLARQVFEPILAAQGDTP